MSGAATPLAHVAHVLRVNDVPFMVAGSFASSLHGLPRTTQDLDIVIDPPDVAALERTVAAFLARGDYADLDAARDAFRRRTMFNVVEGSTGWKIDFVLRKRRPFSDLEFTRRFETSMFDVRVFVATAEDTVIAKLEWSKASGGSERQRRDVRGILEVNDASLDLAYIESWVRSLDLDAEWRATLESPGSL